MSLFSYSYFEEDAIPTLGDVKDEISRMMGLKEIKAQLTTILNEIEIAGKAACYGSKIVPPKPFHMAFIGNTGTGKSMVARVLGKLFYLAGALPSYDLIEMEGRRARIKNAKGGVLFVDVHEQQHNCEVLQEIVDVMDSGKTAVVFAGKRQHLNRCMQANKELYKRLSVTLHFNDLGCEELAMMLLQRLCTDAYKLHSSCSVGTVGKIIEKETIGKLRSKLNGRMVDPIIQEIKNSLALRLSFDAADADPSTITIADLEAGVSNMAKIYTGLLC